MTMDEQISDAEAARLIAERDLYQRALEQIRILSVRPLQEEAFRMTVRAVLDTVLGPEAPTIRVAPPPPPPTQLCEYCKRLMDNLSGISIMRADDGTTRTVCATCADALQGMGWQEVARQK